MGHKPARAFKSQRLVTVTRADDALLHERIRHLRASLREMLDCYWEGDGDAPPEFIVRASSLSGHKSRDPLMPAAVRAYRKKAKTAKPVNAITALRTIRDEVSPVDRLNAMRIAAGGTP